MAYIITRLCRDCLDTGCVAVCPVDCIYEYTGSDGEKFPNQLYIHPDECIDCGACEPECPWQAIFEEVAVPDVFKDDTPLNYAVMEQMDRVQGGADQEGRAPDGRAGGGQQGEVGLDGLRVPTDRRRRSDLRASPSPSPFPRQRPRSRASRLPRDDSPAPRHGAPVSGGR